MDTIDEPDLKTGEPKDLEILERREPDQVAIEEFIRTAHILESENAV